MISAMPPRKPLASRALDAAVRAEEAQIAAEANGVLFDLEPLPGSEPGERLSATRRLTLARRQALADGRHPATGLPLRGDGTTCATCVHLVVIAYARRYWKCERHRLGMSASAASDVRKSWPSCTLYEADLRG